MFLYLLLTIHKGKELIIQDEEFQESQFLFDSETENVPSLSDILDYECDKFAPYIEYDHRVYHKSNIMNSLLNNKKCPAIALFECNIFLAIVATVSANLNVSQPSIKDES